MGALVDPENMGTASCGPTCAGVIPSRRATALICKPINTMLSSCKASAVPPVGVLLETARRGKPGPQELVYHQVAGGP